VAVVGDIRHADQVRRRLSDGPGFRRPPAVHRVTAERGAELFYTSGRAVRVSVPGRGFLRQRAVSGHSGRPADQFGRKLRVPGSRRSVQRPAVRGPVAVLRQGQVQRMNNRGLHHYTLPQHRHYPVVRLASEAAE